MIGTLEVLLLTPTKIATLQAGSIAFDLVQVPVRVALFMAAVGIGFGLDLHVDGIIPVGRRPRARSSRSYGASASSVRARS